MSLKQARSLADTQGTAPFSGTKGLESCNGYPVYQTDSDYESKSGWQGDVEGDLVTQARFWSKVNKDAPNGCWLWTASVTGSGSVRYGQFVLPRDADHVQVNVSAHIYAWVTKYGPIPTGLRLLHGCPGGDNPRCVNWDHLRLGTQGDNVRDAAAKGRMSGARQRVFTTAQRLEIFHLPYVRGLNARLARQYGVAPAVISHIRCGLFVGAPASRVWDVVHGPFQLVPSRQLQIRGEVA